MIQQPTKTLSEHCRELKLIKRDAKANTQLFGAGDDKHGLYFIHEGAVYEASDDAHGNSGLLMIYGPGDILPIRDHRKNKYTYDGYCWADTCFYIVPTIHLARITRLFEDYLAEQLLREVALRDQLATCRQFSTIEKALARVLLLIADKLGETKQNSARIPFRITYEVLRRLTYANIATVMRMVKPLCTTGLFTSNKHEFIINDLSRLRKMADI